MTEAFEYSKAFARNLGWVTEQEQQLLRGKKVAVAGLGGVGGVHVLTLSRLGIGGLHIADFDSFSVANFNRQVGATVSTLDRAKADVIGQMALDINPELALRRFPGVDEGNVDEFLSGVDIYIDGLDFFAFDARRLVFGECAKRRIPAVTVAPVGMGAALLSFLPGRMTFEDYFQWGSTDDEDELALRFLVGLTPAGLHRSYLVDKSKVDLTHHRTPSTIMACQVCAGVAATEALKILLGRGPVRCAPRGVHFDAYRNRLAHTWRPGGNRNPLSRLEIWFGRRQLKQWKTRQ